MDIMRVLPQQDTVQKEGPPGYQLLKAGKTKFQVNVILEQRDNDIGLEAKQSEKRQLLLIIPEIPSSSCPISTVVSIFAAIILSSNWA